jgi:hypothetical protein
MQLFSRSKYFKAVRSPKDEGIVPCKLFENKYRYERPVRVPRFGRLPVNRLYERSTEVMDDILPNDGGIVEIKWLLLRSIDLMTVRVLKAFSRVPVNWFRAKERYDNRERETIEEGTEENNLLSDRYILDNLVNDPIDDGRVPYML